MRNKNKYSWRSYTSFGLGILSPLFIIAGMKPLVPNNWIPVLYIVLFLSLPSSVVLGIIALRKKSEKRLLANISLTLSLLTGIFIFGIILLVWLTTPVHPN